MPYHEVPDSADLGATIAELERKGETIVQVLPRGNSYGLVTVKTGRGGETRAKDPAGTTKTRVRA